jgi:cytochrome P450
MSTPMSSVQDATEEIPVFGLDPFSDELLENPYGYYRQLREVPVFRLAPHDLVGTARFATVRDVLGDHVNFSSAHGPAFSPFMNSPEGLGQTVLCKEGAEHDAVRRMLIDRLRLSRIEQYVAVAEQMADEMIGRFLEEGRFDGMTDLARPFVVAFIGHVLGIPPDLMGLGADASFAAFQALGPDNQRARESAPLIGEFFGALANLTQDDVAEGSVAWDLLGARARGELEHDEPLGLILNFAGPSFDTTIHSIGNTLWLLATHPGQWEILAANPDLIPFAIDEGIRLESALQLWSRVARHDTAIGGVGIPGGTRVALFLGAANRDPRQYPDAEAFDVTRHPNNHLDFGYGIHTCVGAPLARVELTAILRAMCRRRVRTIALAGAPQRRPNNLIRGFASIPTAIS